MKPFEVLVVGGGHAGSEAALAAARMGVEVCLVTLRGDTIGALSCNPAMGGVGKGQILRELDALGGTMGVTTDRTALHYRMLNTSKGEAVRALRAQVDKERYARELQANVRAQARLTVVEGSAESLHVADGRAAGVVLADGSCLPARAVILTNGTFLRGLMHTGEKKAPGGRIGEGAAHGLTASLTALGFETGRLKTGTPPRIAAESIDWARTVRQDSDAEPSGFSNYLPPPRGPFIPCHVTRTNPRAHDVIRANLHRSPMYSGQIEGIGPRYCPSIEDKVVRFAAREAHTVHLEREGLGTNSIYVNGVSTSLPADVQEQVIHAIAGLEHAVFLRYGYAVEYDFFPPHQIELTFESRPLPGLYLAGQICGTSGYEEAGAQGFLAGVNAVLALRGAAPFILARDEAYMGVLADDLVRCDPREPYRMFTARAEYRLTLRFDNADLRLAEKGESLGLVTSEQADGVRARRESIVQTLTRLTEIRSGPEPLLQQLRRPGARFEDVEIAHPEVTSWNLSAAVKEQVLIAARYEKYIERQFDHVERMRRFESWQLPAQMDYQHVVGLRREAVEKLSRFRPRTLGVARRIAGITPADLSVLMVALRAAERTAAAASPSESMN